MLAHLVSIIASTSQADSPVVEVRAPVVRAQPRATLDSYFSREDYPASALRSRQEGTVGIALTVDPTGRVNGCTITRSSGIAALDSTACRILRSRARYTPARDRNGEPVSDIHIGEVTWALSAASLASARPPAPPPPQPAVVPARARANLASYVSNADYPATALRAREQGMVGFVLDVGPDGRVIHCAIEESSGSPALDNTTCRLMRSRARFTPAQDSEGSPVADRVRGRIGWLLPAANPGSAEQPAPPSADAPAVPARARANLASYVRAGDYPRAALLNREEGIVHFRLEVGANGRVTSCTVTRSSGSEALDDKTCMIMRSRALFTPARDAIGNPVPDRMESRIGWHLRGI